MRRRRPVRPWRSAAYRLGAAACTAALAAAAGSAGPAGGAQSTADSGIGTAWATAQGTWAILPLGHLHSAGNTFWQLLFRRSGSARWTLVTPPGVASNGGIVGASTASSTATVTVGFEPARFLSYSPVARTGDEGKRWSAGTLPVALAQVADAMATGSGGEVVALERAKGGTVVQAHASLTHWATVTTGRGLGASGAAASCGLVSLSALTLAAGAPEVGADCTKPGVLGLYARSPSGAWGAVGPALPQESGATMKVLRLTTTSAGTAALVEAHQKKGDDLVALWEPTGQAWRASAPVRIEGTVLSAGTGLSLSLQVVTVTASGSATVHAVAGPGSPWRSTGVPKGTQAAVAATTGSGLTALAVSTSKVAIWSWVGQGWTRTGGFKVPIEYGSST